MIDAELFVAAAFVVFVGVMIYFEVHKVIVEGIDRRTARIKSELDEAQRLRAEAHALLEEYRRKQQEAEREAEALIAGARTEAEQLRAEAKAKLQEVVVRRTKVAEAKIAEAEAQALAEVRAAAADAAVAAAEAILKKTVKGEIADNLINKGIQELKSKIN
jgi:F-type H+-transporting ATPase subunit b